MVLEVHGLPGGDLTARVLSSISFAFIMLNYNIQMTYFIPHIQYSSQLLISLFVSL